MIRCVIHDKDVVTAHKSCNGEEDAEIVQTLCFKFSCLHCMQCIDATQFEQQERCKLGTMASLVHKQTISLHIAQTVINYALHHVSIIG